VPFDQSQTIYNNSLGGYCLVLAVHPTDPNQVFIGGNDLYYSSNGFQDAGTKIGGYPDDPQNPPPHPLHPDMHAIAFSPVNPSRLFVGHDGGVSSTDDYMNGSADWTGFNNGLSSAQVYHSSLDHGTLGSDFIESGLQDNNTYATMSPNPADPWLSIAGGDGMTTGIYNGGSLFFSSWQYASISCFTYSHPTITYHGQLPLPSSSIGPMFFTRYILEPVETNQMYLAETDQLWRFNNLSLIAEQFDTIAPDWSEITSVSDALHPLNAFITSFGFATDIRDRLFFGTNIGKVYQIDDAASTAPTLKDISGASFPQNGFVAGIEADPMNANEIIVVFSNYHIQSLFRTTDGGKTWEAIGGNLEELPDGAGSGPSLRCAKILHTSSCNIYYVGSSVGLYSTTKIDGMNTVWTQEAPTIIGNLIVESLDARQSDGRVIVSTQGGGVFKNASTDAVQNPASSAQQFLQLEQNFPNPFSDESKIRFSLAKPGNVGIYMYNALGENITAIANGYFDSGSHIISISGKKLPAGNYFIRVIAGNNVASKMITIVK
jgi:hypothetical protein